MIVFKIKSFRQLNICPIGKLRRRLDKASDRATKSIIDNFIEQTFANHGYLKAYPSKIDSYRAVDYTAVGTFEALNCPQAASASKPRE